MREEMPVFPPPTTEAIPLPPPQGTEATNGTAETSRPMEGSNFTGITNAPSQQVRLGGPKTPLTGEALAASKVRSYGGPIEIGMSPDSPHPVGSRQNPVNVEASRQANAEMNARKAEGELKVHDNSGEDIAQRAAEIARSDLKEI
jgi:hypothetical protein